MADKAKRFTENLPGSFFVDTECIACDACILAAPDHFKMTEDGAHAFVTKQPESDSETTLCREAMEACPVEAIGSDCA